MRKDLYIFDLDGTLADLRHRRPLVERLEATCLWCGFSHYESKCSVCGTPHQFKPDWDKFHAECVNDTPITPVITVFQELFWSGNEMWVWSGRSDSVQHQTIAWLKSNVEDLRLDRLKMRPAGDYTPDDKLKESWLLAMSPEDRQRLVAVFDDRDRVVAMWRRHGVQCFQAAPGGF